jgi:hypothetical protein
MEGYEVPFIGKDLTPELSLLLHATTGLTLKIYVMST